jgi:hypothetical protein
MRLSFLEGMSVMASHRLRDKGNDYYHVCDECHMYGDSCTCSDDEKLRKIVRKYTVCTRCEHIYEDDQIREDEEYAYVCEWCRTEDCQRLADKAYLKSLDPSDPSE